MADLYKAAGVNIDAGNEAVKRIKTLVRGTYNSQVLGDLGNFGGLFAFPVRDFADPILVSSTDGVGTKLKVAFALQRYDTVGRDLAGIRLLEEPRDASLRVGLDQPIGRRVRDRGQDDRRRGAARLVAGHDGG